MAAGVRLAGVPSARSSAKFAADAKAVIQVNDLAWLVEDRVGHMDGAGARETASGVITTPFRASP